jgi:hypothetical protein
MDRTSMSELEKARLIREEYHEKLQKFLEKDKERLRYSPFNFSNCRKNPKLPSTKEIFDTLSLVEQRNKRVSKLEEQAEKLKSEIKDKLQSIQTINDDLDDTAAFPNRQESLPTSVKKDVAELLQALTKNKFDGLKRRVKELEDDKRRITDELGTKNAEVVRQKGVFFWWKADCRVVRPIERPFKKRSAKRNIF